MLKKSWEHLKVELKLYMLIADISVETIAHADSSESPLDTKCGILHSISQARTADSLFDVKLALTSFDVRKKAGGLEVTDQVLSDDFIERVHFRLWSNAKAQSGNLADTS
jgi:hypothetical protein